MSLTVGPGPLAGDTGGGVNYAIDGPAHRLLFHEHPRRIRAVVAGRTVLDSVRAQMLHETGIKPRIYVPLDDLDASALERTDHTTHCPFKGHASYWSLVVDGERRENAVWAYEDPLPEASWLRGYASVYWSGADEWFEEDDRVLFGFRDPYHRVDARPSSREVEVVAADGTVLARSSRPVLVFETGVPARAYVPLADVVAPLEPSEKRTVCPYKGEARFWSAGGLQDAAWSYDEPLADGPALAGLVVFGGDDVTVRIGA